MEYDYFLETNGKYDNDFIWRRNNKGHFQCIGIEDETNIKSLETGDWLEYDPSPFELRPISKDELKVMFLK
jgi:hypothetical protein